MNGPERSRKTRELVREQTRENQKDKRPDACTDQRLKQKGKRIGPWMDQREAERQENLGVNGQERYVSSHRRKIRLIEAKKPVKGLCCMCLCV